ADAPAARRDRQRPSHPSERRLVRCSCQFSESGHGPRPPGKRPRDQARPGRSRGLVRLVVRRGAPPEGCQGRRAALPGTAEERSAAMKDMSELVFLYGTLIPGQEPAEMTPVVTRLRRIGPARVKGRLYDFGEYPGAILDRSSPGERTAGRDGGGQLARPVAERPEPVPEPPPEGRVARRLREAAALEEERAGDGERVPSRGKPLAHHPGLWLAGDRRLEPGQPPVVEVRAMREAE